MTTTDVLLISDERMLGHVMTPDHPERPDRLRAVLADLRENPLAGTRWGDAPRLADREVIERLHDPSYVSRIFSLDGASERLDPDTAVGPLTVTAARLAVGAGMDAVDAVLGDGDDTSRAFVLVRPPGHHAEPDHAKGFCFFGTIALAADHAVREHGLERVLIVDWDVHHGNGTQHLLEDRADVLVVNTHQYPFYPGTGGPTETGTGDGVGATVNVPLPPRLGDGEYAQAFREVVLPVAERFRPQLVLVSAGFDAHERDALASMEVSDDGFAWMCAALTDLAERHCDGRIILFLEGGYDLQALTHGVRRCLEILTGAATAPEPPSPGPRIAPLLSEIRALHQLT